MKQIYNDLIYLLQPLFVALAQLHLHIPILMREQREGENIKGGKENLEKRSTGK